MKKITIKKGLIEGKERLKLIFEYDKEVIELIRTIPGARWYPGERCWHVATQAGSVEKLNRRFEGKLEFEDLKIGGLGDWGIGGLGDWGILITLVLPVTTLWYGNQAKARSGDQARCHLTGTSG
jgi:hypothetical protein